MCRWLVILLVIFVLPMPDQTAAARSVSWDEPTPDQPVPDDLVPDDPVPDDPVPDQPAPDRPFERLREEGGNDHDRNRAPSVVLLRNGRPEFMTVGPAAQAAQAAEALRARGARVIRTRSYPALGRYAVFFDLRGMPLAQARAILLRAAPDTRMDSHVLYRLSQGKPRLYAASMIDAPAGGCVLKGMRVGLIDGAVDPSHAALSGVRVLTHSVLTGRGTNPNHGTAVAALIAGRDPSGALNGFASGAEIHAVTAFGYARGGPAADVERIGAALDWLLSRDVRLINMSFAGPENAALADVLAAAHRRGAVMIAAAGNDGLDVAAYPAGADTVIAVTAVDAAGRRYVNANTGAHIEFAAPGVDLYVASRGGGTYATGTSYAAPIVTALAARLMAAGAGDVEAVRARLRRGASDLGVPGRDTHFGWGLAHADGC